MRSQLCLHESHAYLLEPPRLGAPLTGFLAGLALAFVFGAAATLALAGGLLRMKVSLPWDGHDDVRWFVLVLGAANCLASVLVASGYGIKLFSVLSHRMGWHPVVESEGPCRLVQDAPGLWGLQMELAEGSDPGAAWPLTTSRTPLSSCHLFFRLDEAAAGAVSHFFSPDEPLVVRWLDLPLAAGGPAILEIRTPVREVMVANPRAESRRTA